jgi:hypothetical protein
MCFLYKCEQASTLKPIEDPLRRGMASLSADNMILYIENHEEFIKNL